VSFVFVYHPTNQSNNQPTIQCIQRQELAKVMNELDPVKQTACLAPKNPIHSASVTKRASAMADENPCLLVVFPLPILENSLSAHSNGSRH